MTQDEKFIAYTLSLAEKGRGTANPNPLVGAVVVKNGIVIGEGFHRKAGESHAEVIALNQAGDEAKGAHLYVNLEPCSHFGRTPPCSDMIIERGIERVVCSMKDTYNKVSGIGIEKLKRAQIKVVCGVLEDEAIKINEVYLKYVSVGLPFVTLKIAQSLDGKIATKTGDSKWITSEESRKHVHRMRAEVDAVLVGINTVLADDPFLNTRSVRGEDPIKIVLDSTLRIRVDSKVLSGAALIVAACNGADKSRISSLEKRGADVWLLPPLNGKVDLKEVMRKAAEQEMSHVMIEGGSCVASSALSMGIVDKIVVFVAPKIIGKGTESIGDIKVENLSDCVALRDVEIERIGDDLMYSAKISRQWTGKGERQ